MLQQFFNRILRCITFKCERRDCQQSKQITVFFMRNAQYIVKAFSVKNKGGGI